MSYSIIFPAEHTEEESARLRALFAELGLDRLVMDGLYDFFTSDRETVARRLDVFRDISELPELAEPLRELKVKLVEYSRSRQTSAAADTETLFRRMIDVSFYAELVRTLDGVLGGVRDRLRSEGLRGLQRLVSEVARSDEFKELTASLGEVCPEVLNARSITVGVNLNSLLEPKEAGLVSVNAESYKSGDWVDRLLRWDFKENGYTTIAPLTTFGGGRDGAARSRELNEAVNAALGRVMRESADRCGKAVSRWQDEHMKLFAGLAGELEFIVRGADYISIMKEKGVPLCFPEPTSGEYSVSGLYNPALTASRGRDEVVPNSLTFDPEGMLYLLTGPNSGGKTVFVRAVGMAQALFQCGLPIPARSARLPLFRSVETHFAESGGEHRSERDGGGFAPGYSDAGRLERECARVAELLARADSDTLVLADEAFSSTGAADGAALARSFLEKLAAVRCRCVFSTHLHELAAERSEINASLPADFKLDTLAAEVYNERRTYKILRGRADGTSDARTIARKYGLI